MLFTLNISHSFNGTNGQLGLCAKRKEPDMEVKFKFSQFLHGTHSLYKLMTTTQTDQFSANTTYLIESTTQS